MELLSHYLEQQKKQHPEIINWKNHIVGDNLSYSFRETLYTRGTYPSNLHYHDYYELVIFEEGDINYICEGGVYHPKYGDIVLIPPGKFHMSTINCESTLYKRHVFYLYPSAFNFIGHNELTSFLSNEKNGEIFTLASMDSRQALMSLLQDLKKTFDGALSSLEEALVLAYVINVFYLMNKDKALGKDKTSVLPEKILAIKYYVDENYSQISSVTDIAEHFFYSREYISRLFRKYFDTTISDYIMQRRIAKSQELILKDLPLIDIAYQIGFGSLSTFIRSFRSVTGVTPSEYRKLREDVFS
ncbi:MAG: AraC family transcriptional regulator [Ruminococcaceae bacterium]|nr:AraC family transcriptional regulator [Oscillospiraceae bacterium]